MLQEKELQPISGKLMVVLLLLLVPAASIYAGRWAAVDEELVREGRLRRISTTEDLQTLSIHKKHKISPRRSVEVIDEVVGLIFE